MMFTCPICKREYKTLPYTCRCGYREDDSSKSLDTLLKIYRYSQMILENKIYRRQSKYDIDVVGDLVTLTCIYEDEAVAYVDLCTNSAVKEGFSTFVPEGVLAFNRKAESLIINADRVDSHILDESLVRILVLGDRVKTLPRLLCSNLSYIAVSSNNPYFTVKDNVLYSKDMTTLIHRCPNFDSEFTIPATVKTVSAYAIPLPFSSTLKLTIHCSKKVQFGHQAIFYPDRTEIVFDQD